MGKKFLKGKKIAYVGGVDSIVQYYKRCVEKWGGVFHHHRGKSAQGKEAVGRVINTADAVFCPLNINSHYACNMVKNACRKSGKPVYFLRTSSISTFRNALAEWGKNSQSA